MPARYGVIVVRCLWRTPPLDRSRSAARYPFKNQQQDLLLVTKDTKGKTSERKMLPVAFVPLIESDETGPG